MEGCTLQWMVEIVGRQMIGIDSMRIGRDLNQAVTSTLAERYKHSKRETDT